MSVITPEPAARPRARTLRLVSFRVVMASVALLHVVGFGAWQALLAPWIVVGDDVDHGWHRTPELHRLADGAAGLLFMAIAAAAIVLTVRPRGRSGLAAWLGAVLSLTGAFSWLSAALQRHDDVASMLVFSIGWVLAVVAIFGWLHPEGRDILRGGTAEAGGVRPHGVVRFALVLLALAGVVAVAAAIGWRLAGGVFESSQEDDVFGLVYLGVAWALGCAFALRGRAGWRPLCWIMIVGAGWALVGGLTVALT